VSCDEGWIVGATFAIDGWRKWMETVDDDYLRGNRDEERCRHKTIRPLLVCVCVCVRERVREGE
jgi:hypothetical protein